ncbi:MAG: glycosyltransferase family 4 protein [bacterium]|nr:glycosyltransferase family 4 protein [bacterium]
MKVLILTGLFPNNQQPNLGIFVKEQVVALNKFCSLKVVAPVPYFPPWKITKKWYKFSQIYKKEIQEGIEIFHPRWFIIPKIGMSFYGLSYFLCILWMIKKIQKEFEFDLINVHFLYPDGFAGILIRKFLHKPVIITVHGSDVNLYFKYPVIRFLNTYASKNADGIITVASSLKDKLIEAGVPGEKITVILNGLDTNKFHHLPKNEMRKELNLPLDRQILLSIGNLIEIKGFHYLIKAISEIKKRGTPLLSIIIGEGEYKKLLQKLIDDLGLGSYVWLIGSKLKDELPKWYNAADLFCLSSLSEGCPLVLLESLSCGTPVVATDVGGCSEIISPDSGILVKPGDITELMNGILKGFETKWDMDKVINTVERNRWERVIENIVSKFNSVLYRN